MLRRLHEYLEERQVLPFASAADQGSGKLRNLPALKGLARRLVLVDTRTQLASTSVRRGRHVPVRDLAQEWARRSSVRVKLLPSDDFERSRLGLSAVFSICVFDVVTTRVRLAIMRAARRNLVVGGWYVVVVPRNDASITSRCTADNAYADGHVFRNRGALTFYRNFDRVEPLIRSLTAVGFELAADLSVHRYVVLLMRAARTANA